jgi:hypothetical protein
MSNDDKRSYEQLGHAVQSGVAMEMNFNPRATDPKHLRTGLDLRAADAEGLATLLIAKGIFTRDEYAAAVTASAAREVERYEARLSERFGRPIRLG